jgi:methyl coenzyme M reductase subunit C-like uncharacterized protein (methanogenesis marker protein 7)
MGLWGAGGVERGGHRVRRGNRDVGHLDKPREVVTALRVERRWP